MRMMSGLRIYISNRLEILADLLAALVKQSPAPPFVPEVVVVQSRGMERWISMRLAQRNGISANIAFPFPNAFIQDLFKLWMPERSDESLFEPDVLAFRIMQIISQQIDRPVFSPLKRYLETGAVSLKLYQLSMRIADTFDQYLVFRPDMIAEWEQGQPDIAAEHQWQVELWRNLAAEGQYRHRALMQKKLIDLLNTAEAAPKRLAPRVVLFGVSYLPPIHLQTLAAVSRHTAVHMFLLNPCREYWADIVSEKEKVKRIRDRISDGISPYDLHLDSGNALLSAMGRLGRDFFSLVSDFEGDVIEHFEEPHRNDRLAGIQSDILNLRDRPLGTDNDPSLSERGPAATLGHDGAPDKITGPDDPSIQIHACHSPQREIEILHDQLLAMFDEDPDLQPQEIVVMTPDIETYAPYIRAVFDTQFDDRSRIPYSIADRAPRNDSHLIDGFRALLDLKDSRFGASQILALLDSPVISKKFALSDSALEKIGQWIDDLNIRWGRDMEHLALLELPQHIENTWRAGIERLLLGVALTDDRPELFGQIRPYGQIAGTELHELGNFLEFLDRVFVWTARLEQRRSVSQWQQMLLELISAFILVDEPHEWDFQLLRSALDELGRVEAAADYHRPVGLDIARAHIEKRLNQPRYGYGYMTGGVTFCAMLPMRSIPFKVVCMIGMDNAAFPRDPTPLGFDLIRRFPRPGDRSQRNDDRYLFLEALLSARHKLYISYVGQNIQDNTSIPPSVLVSELIDYLTQGCGLSEAEIVVRHPLQGFSQRYFIRDTPRLFSYSQENYTALIESAAHRSPSTFLAGSIAPRVDEGQPIDLRQLCRFYLHPTRFLLRQRFGIRLAERIPARADTEVFNLDGLDRYRIGQELVAHRRSGETADDWLAVFRAEGRLPHGQVGETLYRELERSVTEFIAGLNPLVRGATPAKREVDLEVGPLRLVGRLEDLYPHGLLRARFAPERAKDLLGAWIRHLILCVMAEKGRTSVSSVTFLVCLDAIRKFEWVENPSNQLTVLVDAYCQGLQEPLPLFPETSFAYVTQLLARGKTDTQSLRAARKRWRGDDFRRGESQDPYYELAFGRSDPIDGRFAILARTVFEPLLEHSQLIDKLDAFDSN